MDIFPLNVPPDPAAEHTPIPLRANLAMAIKAMLKDVMDSGDIPPVVSVIRKGIPVATILASEIDPAKGLAVLNVVAECFRHDALIMVLDTRYTVEQKGDPHRQWKRGEMGEIARAGQADALGIVDALLVYELAGGKVAAQSKLPYQYNGEGTPLVWFKARFLHTVAADPHKHSGWLYDAITAIAGAKRRRMKGMSAEQIEAAALEALRRTGCHVLESVVVDVGGRERTERTGG
jgi:hypothetical protein